MSLYRPSEKKSQAKDTSGDPREEWSKPRDGDHLKPVTLKTVSCNFRIFRDFVSAFSVLSALLLWNLLRPLFFWDGRDLPYFPHFPCVGFESLISTIRPTGFILTALKGDREERPNRDRRAQIGNPPLFGSTFPCLPSLEHRKGGFFQRNFRSRQSQGT